MNERVYAVVGPLPVIVWVYPLISVLLFACMFPIGHASQYGHIR
jgi:hypothetical protein